MGYIKHVFLSGGLFIYLFLILIYLVTIDRFWREIKELLKV